MNPPPIPLPVISVISHLRRSFPAVSIPPGWTQITRHGVDLSSSCRFSVHHRIAHLLDPYTEKWWYGLNPMVAQILITSAWFSLIWLSRLLVRTIGAIAFRRKVCSDFCQSSVSIASPWPSHAHWIMSSNWGKSVLIRDMADWRDDSLVRSVSIHFTKLAGSDRQSHMISYPTSWKTWARDAQSPDDAPVRIILFITIKQKSTQNKISCASVLFEEKGATEARTWIMLYDGSSRGGLIGLRCSTPSIAGVGRSIAVVWDYSIEMSKEVNLIIVP
jgi:hypothetical protein